MTNKPVVLLLAGGKSTRFWPLSEKNTYTFLNKNLVERHIETLKHLGLHDLIVVASEAVFDWLVENSARFSDININYVKQKDDVKGMAGAVLSAAENFTTHYLGRSLYILNCNDIYQTSLHEQMLSAFETRAQTDVLIAGYKVSHYLPLGYLVVDDGVIQSIVEKPGEDKMPSKLANLVVDLFRDPQLFLETLKKTAQSDPERDDIFELALDQVFKAQRAEAVVYEGRWEILKYPWHILSVMDYFLSQIHITLIDPTAKVSDKATVGDRVILSEGVKVMEGAKIAGPCFIGKNTIIGNNALVRESIVGENCVLGVNSEVARSYLGDNIWLHMNYIGDSVLENNVSLGAGSVTGNFRLDEKNIEVAIKGQKVDTLRDKLGMIVGRNVRFGVNSSIMPGIKIGSGSFVGPGVVLKQDLPDNSYAAIKQEIFFKENKTEVLAREREVEVK